jgi:hypothetical protein
MRPVLLAVAFALISAPASARSPAAEHVVREQIAEACDGKQGKIDPAAITEKDLTGDGNPDLIISHHGIACAGGGRSIFCGMQACAIKIYVRRGALLELAEDTMGVEGVRLGAGAVPSIHMFAHGGKPVARRWNGRAFGPAGAAAGSDQAPATRPAASSAPPSAPIAAAPTPAETPDGCTPIRFGASMNAATVQGAAPPDDTVCFTFTAVAGQRATVRVASGRNIMFAIEDVVDGQDNYSFTTQARTYRVLVGQLMRSVTVERFGLSVSLRRGATPSDRRTRSRL